VNGFGKTLRTPSWRATAPEEPVPCLNLAESSRIGHHEPACTDLEVLFRPERLRHVDDDQVRIVTVAGRRVGSASFPPSLE
jgi:hypothetical protein